MSRSGTSLVARILNLLGVDLGPSESLIPGNERNHSGYWEQRPIFELNEAVLAALGGDYDHPLLREQAWGRSPRFALLRRRAAHEVEELFEDAPLWGFKDPRFSFTLPFWRTVVPEMRYVICVRAPHDVARSYERFTGGGEEAAHHALGLWLRSNASALVHTSDSPRVIALYDEFFDDLPEAVKRLAVLLGRPVTSDALTEIEEFADGGLRHHRGADDVFGDGAAERAERLYAAMRTLAPHPTAAAVRGVEELARETLVADRRASGQSRVALPRAIRPFAVANLPEDLEKVDTFGIHRDGWLDRDAYVVMAAGGPAHIVARATVLPLEDQRLDVIVDGRTVASRSTAEGLVSVRAPLRASRSARIVELRWRTAQRLDAPDGRRVTARLRSLRLVPAAAQEQR